LRGQKPLPAACPKALRSVGDHLRKRRLDLGSLQREVAASLGVRVNTIRNWEAGRNAPAQWQWPAVVAFLGYVPFGTDGILAEKLKAYRRVHGLSQVRLAGLIGVDPSTVWHWEQGRSQPTDQHTGRISALIATM
jgi:DNA-binding transcriptional regulator YiaG